MPSSFSAPPAAMPAAALAGAEPGPPNARLPSGIDPAFRATQQSAAHKTGKKADFAAILARLSEGQGRAREAVPPIAARVTAGEHETSQSDAVTAICSDRPDPEADVPAGIAAPSPLPALASQPPAPLPNPANEPVKPAVSPHRKVEPGQTVSHTVSWANSAPQTVDTVTHAQGTAEPPQAIRAAPAPGIPAPPAEPAPRAALAQANFTADAPSPGNTQRQGPEASETPSRTVLQLQPHTALSPQAPAPAAGHARVFPADAAPPAPAAPPVAMPLSTTPPPQSIAPRIFEQAQTAASPPAAHGMAASPDATKAMLRPARPLLATPAAPTDHAPRIVASNPGALAQITSIPAYENPLPPATPVQPVATTAASEAGHDPTEAIAAGPVPQPESQPARISAPGQLPTAPSPQLAYHVARQIAEAAAQPSRQPVELHLDPEELGPVRLTLSGNDHTLAMTITAERGETLDLMRRHIAVLEQEYRALGYTDIRFSFGTSDNAPHSGHNSDAPPDRRNHHTGAPDEAALPAPRHPHRSAGPDGGLDLRL